LDNILYSIKYGHYQQNQSEDFISKELGISLSTIYVHLAELVEAGFVEYEEKDRKKVYRLTEKGEMLLKALE